MRSIISSQLLAIIAIIILLGCQQTAIAQEAKADSATIDSTAVDSSATDDKDEKWDVATPAVPADTIQLTASEGTWMTLDIHPDGSTIVFDLLGDIYTIPIEGGAATLLKGGLPYEIQPRYSPDGSRILFTSDREGGDNIWVMDADGANAASITSEDFRLLNNGAWHPSGDYLVARKHFTSRRSMGAGEMWLYKVPEGGKGVQLTKRKNDQQDAGEPIFSHDGRYLYWSEDMSGGRTFEYNKDPNQTIYVIRRLDMETGEIRNLVRLPGGSVRPQFSPDSKQLAFVRRVRANSVLCLFDMETGEVRPIWDGLDHDQQEAWAIFGVYSGFDWTPDGKSIVIWAKGKIWRVDVATGAQTLIPFTAQIEQIVAKALRFSQEIGGETFDVKVVRWPQKTQDGKMIFQALGYLYEHDIASGSNRRLTNQTEEFEFAPSLSPDGKKITYVTWNDRTGGRVKIMNAGGGSVRTIVTQPGHYCIAALSHDGKWLVYHRGGGDSFRGRIWDDEPGIYLVPLDGKAEPVLLTREGEKPRFNKNDERIYLNGYEGDQAALISVNRLGSDRRVHATSERAVDFCLSTDEKWLAFEELWHTYVLPFPSMATPLSLAPGGKNLPVKKLSKDAGTYLSWSADSRTINWSLGPDIFSVNVDDLYAEVAGDDNDVDDDAEKPEPIEPTVVGVGWQHPTDGVETDLYLTGGTILPMHDLSVIADGVVHVRGNRIVEVGTFAEVTIPAGAKTIDVSGKTIMPGLVDVHAHVWSSGQSVNAQQMWSMLANLAFGVTTIHDPSNSTEMILGTSELIKAGSVIGPRVFSTGTILYGAEGSFKTVINSYEDAYSAVKRRQAWGAFSVKSYMQPRRDQRQMVIKAAHELGMMVVPEGGSTLHMNISQLLDGHTTLEHNIPVAPLYAPEMWLLTRFGTGYTPTLVVSYGSLSGEKYWYQHTNVWENERLARFVPGWFIEPRSRRRDMAPDEEYHHFKHAATVAKVVHQGGNVQIGSHGQMQGLAAHWELWMFAQGGMTNHEALRAASWMGARAIGLDGQLGSVQVGMLADLIVIDGDPLADIRKSEDIAYTMINGRLFNAMTLDQEAPQMVKLPAGPFLDEVTGTVEGFGCCQH